MPGDDVGLCARCRHAEVKTSARGSEFWRCALADEDARFTRYPPLPVRKCPGFADRDGVDSPSGAPSRRCR